MHGIKLQLGDNYLCFHPKDNITAEELSFIMAYLILPVIAGKGWFSPKINWEASSVGVKRHFKIEPIPKKPQSNKPFWRFW